MQFWLNTKDLIKHKLGLYHGVKDASATCFTRHHRLSAIYKYRTPPLFNTIRSAIEADLVFTIHFVVPLIATTEPVVYFANIAYSVLHRLNSLTNKPKFKYV